jgi:hypothetical protein
VPKKCISRDLPDAISLALVWIDDANPNSIVDNAAIHIQDIAQYAPKHRLIGHIKKLRVGAKSYLTTTKRCSKAFSR